MKMLNIIILIIFLHERFAYPSVIPDVIKPEVKNLYRGYDCPGNDIFAYRTGYDTCQESCRRTSDCTHFVWLETNNYTCSLKKGLFSEKNLKKINATNTIDPTLTMCVNIDGDKLKPEPELEKFNNTLEYKWDCELPVCSRKTSVLLSESSVKKCLADGNSLSKVVSIEKIGEFSIPFYNPTYMCNNQQPWFVNDSLAYGYGSMESDTPSNLAICCICYKLNFIDEILKKKTMFIQIINHNQGYSSRKTPSVELYAPGHGLHTGQCGQQWKQWNWQRYPSKVQSREDCSDLAEPIQTGCFFKYDWLNEIEKPNITYTKVQCPKELNDKSECHQGVV